MVKLPREHWDAYLDWLADFEYSKMELPAPDLVIYLDMDPGHLPAAAGEAVRWGRV